MTDLSEVLKQIFGEQLKINEPMSAHTTLEIGGSAKFFLEVKSQEMLLKVLTLAREHLLSYLIIGGGSNLLVSDEPLDLLVIKNSIQGISQPDQTLTAASGTPLQNLVDYSIEHGLAGLQKLTGIPGSIGGAIFGNAGAYGQTISDHLIEVSCLDPKTLEIVKVSQQDAQFAYRDSGFKTNGLIILEASFALSPAKVETLKQESTQTLKVRLEKYKPGIKCPGSFFKNILVSQLSPEILAKIPSERIVYGKIPAGFLLEAVGVRGLKYGQIEIAPFHGNLIMNLGEGKASDFYQIARECIQRIKSQFGITLKPEVQLINLPDL